MNIVIAAFNARFTHSSLAIRYLRNALEAAGAQQVILREFWITRDRIGIIQDLVMAQPDVLMLSVQIWNSDLVAGLIPDLKCLLPQCRLIIGGTEVSYNAPEWLARFPELDLVVCGPGEGVMAQLHSVDFDIPRLAPQRLIHGGAPDFALMDFPYRDSDFKELQDRYLYYESSRGCPFACSYCLSSRDDQAQVFKSIQTVCAELDRILSHRPMLVKFVDRTFNADPQRSRHIWQHLIAHHNPDTGFHFEIHPALLEPADYVLLAKAPPGLFQFEIGVQSVNPKPLAAIGRPVNWEAVRDGIKRLIAIGTIHIHLDLIVGLPHEGMVEIQQSFDAIAELTPHHFQMGFLKGLHGTMLRQEASQWGMQFSTRPPYQILCNHRLTVANLVELSAIEQLVDNVFNTHHIDSEMQAAAQHFGGAFSAYRHLAAFCQKAGFDIRTRQAGKLQELAHLWRSEW